MKWINYRRKGETLNTGLNLHYSSDKRWSAVALRLPLWIIQGPRWLCAPWSFKEILTRFQWQIVIAFRWNGMQIPPYFNWHTFQAHVGDPVTVITQEQICSGIAVSMV